MFPPRLQYCCTVRRQSPDAAVWFKFLLAIRARELCYSVAGSLLFALVLLLLLVVLARRLRMATRMVP